MVSRVSVSLESRMIASMGHVEWGQNSLIDWETEIFLASDPVGGILARLYFRGELKKLEQAW